MSLRRMSAVFVTMCTVEKFSAFQMDTLMIRSLCSELIVRLVLSLTILDLRVGCFMDKSTPSTSVLCIVSLHVYNHHLLPQSHSCSPPLFTVPLFFPSAIHLL